MRIEAHEKFRHLGGFARGQAGRRLIEQQDFRIAGETEHDLELALLTVRQVAHLGVFAIHELSALQQAVGFIVDVAIR